MMLPPPVLHGWEGVLRIASLPLFPPNITMVIMAKQLYFCFIRPEDTSQKVRSLSPCAAANCSLAFLRRFWCSVFFLAEWPFRLGWYRTRFTVDKDTLHQSMFISKRQNASPSWAVWRLRGPMVFFLAYYCLYRWTWYLQAFGNCSQGWTRLNFFSEVLADFFWFSHDVKQRGTEFEGRPRNTSTYILPSVCNLLTSTVPVFLSIPTRCVPVFPVL